MHSAVMISRIPESPSTALRGAGGQLVLLCGRSFSGKSTVAAWLGRSLPATVVSLDAINAERGLAGGQGIPVEEWAKTNEEARRRAASALREGAVVVVDDTASLRFLRDAWRAVAEDSGAVFVLVFLDTPLGTIRARLLRNRGGLERPDVVDAVMAEHLASFEAPGEDEAPVTVQGDDLSQEGVVARVQDAFDHRRLG